jgi:hypothetical protein
MVIFLKGVTPILPVALVGFPFWRLCTGFSTDRTLNFPVDPLSALSIAYNYLNIKELSVYVWKQIDICLRIRMASFSILGPIAGPGGHKCPKR